MEAPKWGCDMSAGKPSQLQVNNTGAWKTVCRFDAGDQDAGAKVMTAAIHLQQVDSSLKFRIATADHRALALMQLQKGEWKASR